MQRPARLLGSLLAASGLLLSIPAQSATVLITGTNRGIGLEFVRQYAEAGWTVIGTARNPAAATELQALAKQHPGVSVERLDVADAASIAALAARLKGRPIDVLINNAGTLGDVPKQTIGTLDHAVFDEVMAANTFGALKLSEALNVGFRSLAADWRGEGLMVGIIAPGMVETDLLRASGFPGRGITPQESVAGMIKVIDAMTLANNGKALNYDGSVIPW